MHDLVSVGLLLSGALLVALGLWGLVLIVFARRQAMRGWK